MAFFRKCKRQVVYSIVSTGLGKNAVISMLPLETQNIITALSAIVSHVRGHQKGAEIKEQLVRFMVSVGLQKDAGFIRFRDLAQADAPLRKAFDLLCKLFNFYDHNPHNRDLQPHFERVEGYFKEVEKALTALLGPHYQTPEDAKRLGFIMSEVATAQFFSDVWADASLEDHMFDLYNTMNIYTQFHYHYGDKDN